MSAPWWVVGPGPITIPDWSLGSGATSSEQPVLLQADRASVVAGINSRIAAYTPEWTVSTIDDAGVALVTLFGAMMEPVLTRLNRLPEKAFVEALRILGIDPLPAEPAAANLQFSILNTATDPVFIPTGFQVGARSTAGISSMIFMETQANLYATAAQIAQLQVQEGSFYLDVTANLASETQFYPFGSSANAGTAFYIGLQSPAQPQLQLSIGFDVDMISGAPAPFAAGGLMPLPSAPTPILIWEAYDGVSGSFQTVSINTDSTNGLVQSGIVVLDLPAVWNSGTPTGISTTSDLYWLRLRIVQGQFNPVPSVTNVLLNLVPALAVQTVADEVLNFGTDTTLQTATLSQIPVNPGSLEITILNDPNSPTDETVWQQTQDLAAAAPDAQVYEFDPATGQINFGDGITHGAAVPPGFRNVVASYQAISPSSGVLAAGSATTLISSAPNITGVSNPDAGSGGTETGTQAEAINRGPQLYRARNRAVTTADFALLATQVGGIVKANAISGQHPSYPGKPIPGVVGVYVVPPDTNPTPGQGVAPTPTAETLNLVATTLSQTAALAGIDVVVAAPVYHYVQAQVSVVANSPTPAAVYQGVLTTLINYFHPITGGADGNGWPFGAPLIYTQLILFLMSNVDGLEAIPSLTLVINGQRIVPCSNFSIGQDSLFWSLQHQIVPSNEVDGS